MATKKRPLADALRSSVAAEDAAVLDRFAKADLAMLGTSPDSPPEPPPAPEPPKIVEKPPEPIAVAAGVTRLTYSIPANEALIVEDMLFRAARAGHRINRSELVRAALHVLSTTPDDAFVSALMSVVRLKPGPNG